MYNNNPQQAAPTPANDQRLAALIEASRIHTQQQQTAEAMQQQAVPHNHAAISSGSNVNTNTNTTSTTQYYHPMSHQQQTNCNTAAHHHAHPTMQQQHVTAYSSYTTTTNNQVQHYVQQQAAAPASGRTTNNQQQHQHLNLNTQYRQTQPVHYQTQQQQQQQQVSNQHAYQQVQVQVQNLNHHNHHVPYANHGAHYNTHVNQHVPPQRHFANPPVTHIHSQQPQPPPPQIIASNNVNTTSYITNTNTTSSNGSVTSSVDICGSNSGMIGDTDVLCGRRGVKNAHPGNLRYKDLVRQYQDSYAVAKKQEKQMIAKLIVDTIKHNYGGRFLKFDSKANLWLDVGVKKACEKTSQTLRDQCFGHPHGSGVAVSSSASSCSAGSLNKSSPRLIRGPRIRIFKERMMLDEATEASSMCSGSTVSSPCIVEEASTSSETLGGYGSASGHHPAVVPLDSHHALGTTVYVRSN
mmetsp:Transcript_6893/g.10284  ORF Transcript_6893/g.10284 Transcript_6893/m.10284 type:complete len:465 (-) Transcript_6893:251-1645(-)|eukprot:CAMPEP_0116015046 /NCGR_PEP_ID=MMETSP0321-20121206/6615_1 /TAXON_ID=163516 /ORGANISM="Leptocylindrus danicus var. danicus, Strain B650" /LENGTH=464 /DNA_ID=CAMNT_0003484765 /DNA_START=80 /DNA_END=1474 /DNA_ORIENTATION=+